MGKSIVDGGVLELHNHNSVKHSITLRSPALNHGLKLFVVRFVSSSFNNFQALAYHMFDCPVPRRSFISLRLRVESTLHPLASHPVTSGCSWSPGVPTYLQSFIPPAIQLFKLYCVIESFAWINSSTTHMPSWVNLHIFPWN